MPYFPVLQEADATRREVDVFRGYNHNLKINMGYNSSLRVNACEFFDMQNLTSEYYPLMSTRKARKQIDTITAPAGLITKDAVIYVDGSKVVINGLPVEMDLSTASGMVPKQLISMGAYLLIWPDKKYINTADLNDKGSMESSITISGQVTVTLCRRDGGDIGAYTKSPTAPEDPADKDYWMDTSGAKPGLYQWDANSMMWIAIATTYIKISAANIGAGFEQFDGVKVSGFQDASLNQTYAIYAKDTDYIVVVGILTDAVEQTGGVTVKREVPDMDYLTECDNRIWGCKYGLVGGKAINEIYACKLGDFKNWNCFMGLSTDSYAVSRGSDGVFTGAATYLGNPIFFKEDCIEKVYPAANGAHQVVTTIANGVQKGSWRSLRIVGNVLYYKGVKSVCAYTGSLPATISAELGEEEYRNARAGSIGGRYYISMQGADDAWTMLVYDTQRGLWHREDATQAMCFTEHDEHLLYIDEPTGKLMQTDGGENESFTWNATTGVIGFSEAGEKYLSRFVIRADVQGTFKLEMRYDEEDWYEKGFYHGVAGIKSFVLPVSPRRCDHVSIRVSGKGTCKVYSVAAYYEKGSDVHW